MFPGEMFERLQELIGSSPVLTTAHILAEASNLAEGRHAADVRGFLRSMVLEQLEEPPLAARDVVTNSLFLRLGLTDAGIATLAAQRPFRVITVDRHLWAALLAAHIDAVNPYHEFEFDNS